MRLIQQNDVWRAREKCEFQRPPAIDLAADVADDAVQAAA